MYRSRKRNNPSTLSWRHYILNCHHNGIYIETLNRNKVKMFMLNSVTYTVSLAFLVKWSSCHWQIGSLYYGKWKELIDAYTPLHGMLWVRPYLKRLTNRCSKVAHNQGTTSIAIKTTHYSIPRSHTGLKEQINRHSLSRAVSGVFFFLMG